MTCCPTCQNANLQDASAEFDEDGEGEVHGLKCFACGWRGQLSVPVVNREEPMGKWSDEAKAALKARRESAKQEEASTAVATVRAQIPISQSVSVDGSVLTVLDAAILKLQDDQTVLVQAREVLERMYG